MRLPPAFVLASLTLLLAGCQQEPDVRRIDLSTGRSNDEAQQAETATGQPATTVADSTDSAETTDTETGSGATTAAGEATATTEAANP